MSMRQRGFTLVEVMIAMVIGLLVGVVVLAMFAGSSKTYKIASAVGELQETGRAAMDVFQRDARMVGYRGCNSHNLANISPLTNQIAAPTAYLNDFANGLLGYESTGLGWNPALPAEITAPAAGALLTDSDVLIMRVATGTPIGLSATMTSATADVPLMAVTSLSASDRVVVADCARATIFQTTGFNGNALVHSAGPNSSGTVLRAFGEDASVMRFETHAYFVAPSARNPATERSLWVQVDDNAPEEVVEDVERFLVLYGEDTDVPGDYVPNVFSKASGVTNWQNVIALQVSLLLRGTSSGNNDVVTDYVYDGATTTPPDTRVRRVYTATIQLRNRTL
jgi:type IV pilus assembly protein PilW